MKHLVKSYRKSNQFLGCILLLASFIGFVLGCGGGTTGTGGNGARVYQGRVVDIEGEVLASVAVTIAETGESDLTNSAGEFSIESNEVISSVTFLIEEPDAQAMLLVNEIPDDAKSITLEIEFDQENEEARLKESAVETDQSAPRPTATPTPRNPKPTPSARPTIEPTPPMEVKPGVDPTVAVTPTPFMIPTFRIFGTISTPGKRFTKSARIYVKGGVVGLGSVNSDGTFDFSARFFENKPIKITFKSANSMFTQSVSVDLNVVPESIALGLVIQEINDQHKDRFQLLIDRLHVETPQGQSSPVTDSSANSIPTL